MKSHSIEGSKTRQNEILGNVEEGEGEGEEEEEEEEEDILICVKNRAVYYL